MQPHDTTSDIDATQACVACNDVPLKRCNLCRQELPASPEYFQPRTDKWGGLAARCRKCCSQQQMELRKTFAERKQNDDAARLDGLRCCRVCKKYKPASEDYFGKRRCNSTGLNSMCKECQSVSNAATYARRKADPVLAAIDGEKSAERSKRWARKNPDKVRQVQRAYRKKKAEDFRLRARARTESEARLPRNFSKGDRRFALDWWHGCCAYCGRPPSLFRKLAMDHFVPITNSDCEGKIPSNMLPACHGVDGCNNSKHDRDPEEWIMAKFGEHRGREMLCKIQEFFSQVRQI